MKSSIDRRGFVRTSGCLLAGAALPGLLGRASPAQAKEPEKRIKKALGWRMIQGDLSAEDKLRLIKDVGFEGVEVPAQFPKRDNLDPPALARASEKVGVPVHGVSGAGSDLPTAIDAAAIYGATSVLYVVRADRNTSYLEQYRHSQEVIREAIPRAEKKKIPILIENVWATFLIEPLTMARYIDELDSPFVQSYFDVGNVMRWGWPQQWIEVLGKRIGKIHIKEYNLKVAMNEGMRKGFDFPLGQGDIDWKRVCAELKKIDYRGWATAEVRGGDRQRLADISSQMDGVLKF